MRLKTPHFVLAFYQSSIKLKVYLFFTITISLSFTACTTVSTNAHTAISQPTLQATAVSTQAAQPSTASLTLDPTRSNVVPSSTPAPTKSTQITPTVRDTPTLSPAFPLVVGTETSLEGPLIAYRVNNDQGFHITILDIGTRVMREIRNDLVNYPLELQWFGDGCLLFVRGRLIDLTGNVVWEIPLITERGWDLWSFGDARLSPDKNWLIVPLYSGSPNYNSAEFVNLEAVNLTNLSPPIPLTQKGGAHASATWSPDGKWLTFSDYDSQGIPQVFQVTPDGLNSKQLTFHTEPIGGIHALVWKPDGSQIAYAVTNRFPNGEHREAWLGIINLDNQKISRIQPSQLGFIDKVWWSLDSERLVFTGESLLPHDENDPLAGSQIHWVDSTSGHILNSFYDYNAPFGWFLNPYVIENIDTIFFASKNGYYLLNGNGNTYDYLGDLALNGLELEAESSPFNFPGEVSCMSISPRQ